MASINLRSLIDNVLNDVSNDLRHQCNTTNTALQQRVDEVDGAKVKLQNHLKRVVCLCCKYTQFSLYTLKLQVLYCGIKKVIEHMFSECSSFSDLYQKKDKIFSGNDLAYTIAIVFLL